MQYKSVRYAHLNGVPASAPLCHVRPSPIPLDSVLRTEVACNHSQWRRDMRVLILAFSIVALSVGCGDDSTAGDDAGTNHKNAAIECGDEVIGGLEECDDGPANSDTLPNACRTNCLLSHCGDGVIDTDELCDDGPQNSDEVPDSCRSDCTTPGCGDGVVDVGLGETCDEGAAQPTDTCNPNCQAVFCGNGDLDSAEVCDDGNYTGGDGCSANCLSDETCGNGYLDAALDEQCDDAVQNSNSTPNACREDCSLPRCGDGVMDSNEACDGSDLGLASCLDVGFGDASGLRCSAGR